MIVRQRIIIALVLNIMLELVAYSVYAALY